MRGRERYTAPRAFERPAPSPQDLRQRWNAAIELAGVAARDAIAIAEGAQIAPSGQAGQVLTRLGVALRDLAPANFPAPGNASRIVAACFLAAARGFTEPVGSASAERCAIAPFLAVMAREADERLVELRKQESQSWRRATGERDDD
jgi:hypothetical protein